MPASTHHPLYFGFFLFSIVVLMVVFYTFMSLWLAIFLCWPAHLAYVTGENAFFIIYMVYVVGSIGVIAHYLKTKKGK